MINKILVQHLIKFHYIYLFILNTIVALQHRSCLSFRFLGNVTQSTIYVESVIKVMTKDGTARTEIVVHSVNDNLGIIHEADFVIK